MSAIYDRMRHYYRRFPVTNVEFRIFSALVVAYPRVYLPRHHCAPRPQPDDSALLEVFHGLGESASVQHCVLRGFEAGFGVGTWNFPWNFSGFFVRDAFSFFLAPSSSHTCTYGTAAAAAAAAVAAAVASHAFMRLKIDNRKN